MSAGSGWPVGWPQQRDAPDGDARAGHRPTPGRAGAALSQVERDDDHHGDRRPRRARPGRSATATTAAALAAAARRASSRRIAARRWRRVVGASADLGRSGSLAARGTSSSDRQSTTRIVLRGVRQRTADRRLAGLGSPWTRGVETEYHLGMVDPRSLVAALDEAGYRMTEPRRPVSRLIADRRGHFTAADLVDDAEAAPAGHRPGDHLSGAGPLRGLGRRRTARPAVRRARVRPVRADPPPPRHLLELRPDRGDRRPRDRRGDRRDRPADRLPHRVPSTSSCSACARPARPPSPTDPTAQTQETTDGPDP